MSRHPLPPLLAAFLLLALFWMAPAPLWADHGQHMSTGISALEAGRFDDAERAFRAVLADQPEQRDALTSLGIAQLRSGNLRAAFATLHSVRSRHPDDPAVYFHLAEVYYRAGLDSLERDALTIAIRLDPGHLVAHRHLAHALTQSGALYAAAVEFDFLIAQANADGIPPHPSVLLARALIHERHNQLSQAVAMLQDLLFLHPEGSDAEQARSHLERLQGRLNTANETLTASP